MLSIWGLTSVTVCVCYVYCLTFSKEESVGRRCANGSYLTWVWFACPWTRQKCMPKWIMYLIFILSLLVYFLCILLDNCFANQFCCCYETASKANVTTISCCALASKVGALSNAAILPSARPPFCLSHAPSSKTVHFRAMVTIGTLIGNSMLVEVEATSLRGRRGQSDLDV